MAEQTARYEERRRLEADRFEVSVGRLHVNDADFPYSFIRIRPGVCVLPLIEGEGEPQTVLIRQFRPATGSMQVELPAGAIDEGEQPRDTAARELAEETGYVASELVDLGPFHPSPGATAETIHLFLARCGGQTSDARPDASEDIRQRVVPLSHLEGLIASGEFRHGAGLAAWARAQARGLLSDQAQPATPRPAPQVGDVARAAGQAEMRS